jgi:Fe2+ or Zn2+ uptake regulation protein
MATCQVFLITPVTPRLTRYTVSLLQLTCNKVIVTQTEFVTQAEQAIADAGGRMTNARRVILDVMAASHEHLTAEDIIARAQKRDRAVNASTVYRTLAFLKSHGLIKSRYFDQDNHREVFEPMPNAEHYHFTCSRCGVVIEFDSPHVASLRRQLQAEYGVAVARACLCLTGLCAKCKRKQVAR